MTVDVSHSISEEKGHLHLRLLESHKRCIEAAAAIRGQTVTDFVKTIVLDHAEKILKQEQRLVLSAEAMAEFIDTLDHAPDPNGKLKRLMAE